jgi:predicted nuclease with TOPRIM domain
MELKAVQDQMSQLRQREADDLKRQLQKMKAEFDQEREEWGRIIGQFQSMGSVHKNDMEAEKQKYMEEKNRLKTKITELKMRLKEKEGEKGSGETELLIKSLREMNNNEAHFTNYEDAITFMDRQVRKATTKIEEKNR